MSFTSADIVPVNKLDGERSVPTDFRILILKRLKQLGKSRYWLAEKVGDSPSRTTIYEFLRGEHELYSTHLAKLLDALEIPINLPPSEKPRS